MSDGPVTGTLHETSFEEGETSFRNFLEGAGFGSNLIWVFREDVIIVAGGDAFVRTPLPPDNRQRAMQCFELGKKRDFGVKFQAFGLLRGVPCAYVSLPKDDLDAQYNLMGNLHLKLAYTTPTPEVKQISSFIGWNIRQLIAKHSRVLRADDEVPSRRTLLPPGY